MAWTHRTVHSPKVHCHHPPKLQPGPLRSPMSAVPGWAPPSRQTAPRRQIAPNQSRTLAMTAESGSGMVGQWRRERCHRYRNDGSGQREWRGWQIDSPVERSPGALAMESGQRDPCQPLCSGADWSPQRTRQRQKPKPRGRASACQAALTGKSEEGRHPRWALLTHLHSRSRPSKGWIGGSMTTQC